MVGLLGHVVVLFLETVHILKTPLSHQFLVIHVIFSVSVNLSKIPHINGVVQ